MDITGEYRLAAGRQRVWEALHDANTLKECIPGCEALERVSDEEVRATIAAVIGPVKSRFETTILLSNLQPPERYTMSGEGRGGAAGFGRGSADIVLLEEGEVTVLRYAADLKVGGRLAQVGSRLVIGVTRKLADEFFDSFAREIGAVPTAAGEVQPGRRGRGVPWPWIVGGAVVLGALAWWLLR